MPRNHRRLRLALWLALTAATAGVWAASDRAFRRREVPTSVVLQPEIAYHQPDGHRLALDLYLPPDDAPSPAPGPGRPAILMIHGGSWIGGSKRLLRPSPWDPHPTTIRLAEKGFVVVAADYRLARPGVPSWPDARDDLREAVRWIRRHAPKLGVDPGRIAALGQSAGAHLAAVLATPPGPDDESARIQAAVGFSGPSDLERLPMQRVHPPLPHEPVRLFLGGGAAIPPEVAREASPTFQVGPETAPLLLIHGSRDRWVPITQSEEFARRLQDVGVAHRSIRVEGARHGFEAQVKEPQDRDLLPDILDFLRSVWKPSGG